MCWASHHNSNGGMGEVCFAKAPGMCLFWVTERHYKAFQSFSSRDAVRSRKKWCVHMMYLRKVLNFFVDRSSFNWSAGRRYWASENFRGQYLLLFDSVLCQWRLLYELLSQYFIYIAEVYSIILCLSLAFLSFFFLWEDSVIADVCNDFVGLSGKNAVIGSTGFGFFGWVRQSLCISLNFWQLVIETKNEWKLKGVEKVKNIQTESKNNGKNQFKVKLSNNDQHFKKCKSEF